MDTGPPIDDADAAPPVAVSASIRRGAGVLLHVTSLPGFHADSGPALDWGIGDLGPAAHAWVDRLEELGLHCWQVLPLGPTGFGNSPYQAQSSLALNELLLSPEALVADGLLDRDQAKPERPPRDPASVDFGAVIPAKARLLDLAWEGFRCSRPPLLGHEFEAFRERSRSWLDDVALHRALKEEAGGAPIDRWPRELLLRRERALARARTRLRERVDRHAFAQWLLARQAGALLAHARRRRVRILGDLPFYPASDSCDVWAAPQWFLLDAQRKPIVVGGVPPDAFSADGQRWGNPVFDWQALAADGFRWSIERIQRLLQHVDLVRLDHFRGFAAAWHVPAGSTTAREGRWVPGPGAALFERLKDSLAAGDRPLPLVAEDLGVITPDVVALRDRFGIPGTRVLQFGFDGGSGNLHHPDNYPSHVVAYTGTHDNPTTRSWFAALDAVHRRRVTSWLGLAGTADAGSVVQGLVGALWASMADQVVVPLQDVLVHGGLGDEGRMNTPGRGGDNWAWRCTAAQMAAWDAAWLAELTTACSRGVGLGPSLGEHRT